MSTPMGPPSGFSGTFRSDLRARAAYAEGAGIYRILPQAIALPASVADLQRLVCHAAELGFSLIPRGAGSAMPGSSVGEGVIVDLANLAPSQLDLDPARRRVRTAAGITWGQLTEAAAHHGLRLPPDPSSGAFATLGGMVATNAAGARSVKYGPVRGWVNAVDLVTADGDTCNLIRGKPPDPITAAAIGRFIEHAAPAIARSRQAIAEGFPKTAKNTAGLALDAYATTGDLIDLIIGSEGTLGIITRIEWALDAVPAEVGAMLICLGDLGSLGEVVAALTDLEPSAIELLDQSFLDILPSAQRPAGEAVLLVEFEAESPRHLRAVVGDAVRSVAHLADNVRSALAREESADLWRLRHAASPILARLPDERRSLQVIEDGCVPVRQLTTYLRFVKEQAALHEIPVVIFGHAGDGHLHVNVLPDVRRPGWEERVSALMSLVTEEVIRLGGTPSGEHGDGRLRARMVERLYGPSITGLFRQVKTAFDPRGILNPGVILPDSTDPLSHLKTGMRAIPLPTDIAESLREMERSARYQVSRLTLADRN